MGCKAKVDSLYCSQNWPLWRSLCESYLVWLRSHLAIQILVKPGLPKTFSTLDIRCSPSPDCRLFEPPPVIPFYTFVDPWLMSSPIKGFDLFLPLKQPVTAATFSILTPWERSCLKIRMSWRKWKPNSIIFKLLVRDSDGFESWKNEGRKFESIWKF